VINTIINGDTLTELKKFPDNLVDCVITSPPYWGLRSYNVDGQIGQETTFQEYVKNICIIFDEIKRVLKNEGTCFLNLGDTYISKGESRHAGYTDPKYTNGRIGRMCEPNALPQTLPEKCLAQVPSRVAIELTDRGWWLRNTIIWHKTNQMPSSVKDRYTVDFEYVYFLTKSKRYHFEQQFEPIAESTIGRGLVDFGGKKGREYIPDKDDPNYRNGTEQWGRTFDYKKSCAKGRNKRTVWSIPTKPFRDAHFATFNPKLIEPMIKAGCPVNGVVLDPFMGAGTTGVVAKMYGRNYIGIELNPDYVKMAENRIHNTDKCIISDFSL